MTHKSTPKHDLHRSSVLILEVLRGEHEAVGNVLQVQAINFLIRKLVELNNPNRPALTRLPLSDLEEIGHD